MALGGHIEVSARVNGEPQLRTDTATVTVTRRNWAGQMPYPAALPPESIAPQRFPLLPVTQDSGGYDVWIPGALGAYSYAIDWFGRFTPIGSGPNKGYWFLREPPEWADPVVYLSGHLQSGHRFYEAQTGRRPGEGNPP
ncbi:MAG TPA: hypothetical protein VFG99_00150, partial [Chloroflexia bacterium]|nr:hypothetical protein [Chloroflexia bacterium]